MRWIEAACRPRCVKLDCHSVLPYLDMSKLQQLECHIPATVTSNARLQAWQSRARTATSKFGCICLTGSSNSQILPTPRPQDQRAEAFESPQHLAVEGHKSSLATILMYLCLLTKHSKALAHTTQHYVQCKFTSWTAGKGLLDISRRTLETSRSMMAPPAIQARLICKL